jgi:NAD(P)-dependent dehydrogenase (short-subunit alcohol dehydrogenase family)
VESDPAGTVRADEHPRVALVTGGSRGIGAAAALALALRGYDVALTYRNKASRAQEVAREISRHGQRALWVGCDITQAEDIARLFAELGAWRDHLDILLLNASGGLERDLVAADSEYPMRINRDAQLAVVEAALPYMPSGGTIGFVTSHWAHLYGQVEQLPGYLPVAASKHAGERELRLRQEELAHAGIRLLVITGDLIEGTITPKLLERVAPGLTEARQSAVGRLPTATEMGEIIAAAVTNPALPGGHTIVVGGALDSFQS